MTTSKAFSRFCVAAMLAAGTVLMAAGHGASAKGGGDHDKMKSHESNGGSNLSDKLSQKHKDKDEEKYSEKHRDKGKEYSEKIKHKDKDKDAEKYSEKHKDKGKEYAEKKKDKDKHNTAGSSTASNSPHAPGTGGTNTIHPIPSPAPVASSSGSPAGVTPPVNTIHPISSPVPVASSSGSPAGVTPPVNTIVRDHRHPPAGDVGPQSGINPDGYTTFEDFDSLGLGHLAKGISDFGYGLTHGTLGGGPAPEDPTSTSTQY
jgi:hypothetical protein